MSDDFYVYLHRRKTDGRVFYVGKGRGKRAFAKCNRNKHWQNTAAKHGFDVQFVETGIPEALAFELERELIALIGRDALCNVTDGGDGVAGFTLSAESIEKMKTTMAMPDVKEARSKWQRGVAKPEDTKAKIAQTLRGRKPSERERAAYVEAMKDPAKRQRRLDARASLYLSDDYRRKMSVAAFEAQNRPEVKAAKSAQMKGTTKSEEEKIRIGESVKRKLADPAVKEKLRAAVKAAWAKRKAAECLGA